MGRPIPSLSTGPFLLMHDPNNLEQKEKKNNQRRASPGRHGNYRKGQGDDADPGEKGDVSRLHVF
jgi:hypothetical protein